jgi:hypothetical protein
MPRARSQVEAIIDQLATMRAHIQSLNQTLANQVCLFYILELATACLMIYSEIFQCGTAVSQIAG